MIICRVPWYSLGIKVIFYSKYVIRAGTLGTLVITDALLAWSKAENAPGSKTLSKTLAHDVMRKRMRLMYVQT
jgi:hypothetical protein